MVRVDPLPWYSAAPACWRPIRPLWELSAVHAALCGWVRALGARVRTHIARLLWVCLHAAVSVRLSPWGIRAMICATLCTTAEWSRGVSPPAERPIPRA